jgi:hypothetical protein
VWALWVLSGLAVWAVLAVVVGVVVGRSVRLADRRSATTLPAGTLTTADLPAALRAG